MHIENDHQQLQMDDSAFQADLAAALDASAATAASQTAELRLDRTFPPLARSSGFCLQRNLLNQFHDLFRPAIAEHRTGSAICGYLTIAHVRLLRSLLARFPARPLTMDEVTRLGDALMASPDLVLLEVERAMASIRCKRARYVAAHRADFDKAAEDQYYRAWVANYEISDELRESLDTDEPVASIFASVSDGSDGSDGSPPVYFSRFNEWVFVGDATHEEKERIASEQRRFGGRVDDNGVTHFGDGESAAFLERFRRRPDEPPELLTPHEWAQAEAADGAAPGSLRVWAVDTSGHFYAALTCRVARAGAAAGEADDVLLAFNTTSGSYLSWPMAGLLHGFVFASAPASDATGGAAAVEELTAMGFEASAAQAALAGAAGCVPRALDVLLRAG